HPCALHRNRQELRFDLSLFAIWRRSLCGGTLYRLCSMDCVPAIFVGPGRGALRRRTAKKRRGEVVTPTNRTAAPLAAPDVERLARGLRAGGRTVLSRGITLIESKRADHRRSAAALMQLLLPHTGTAIRVGITGAPGVGKSTLIDALGSMLTAQARKIAVLAVDPSSRRTGGAILADKTRMARPAHHPNALIFPPPSPGPPRGGAPQTRGSQLLFGAARHHAVLVR